jgi:hypothetical protein
MVFNSLSGLSGATLGVSRKDNKDTGNRQKAVKILPKILYFYKMNNSKKIEQNFIIDSLTNSILNTVSGDSFQTEIIRLSKSDLKYITKKKGWSFNWKAEFDEIKKEVYKLTIVNNPSIIQGLLSVTIEQDYVFMDLLESAPFNIGKNKIYEGVAGNLVAYACKISFQKGYEGYVAFTAKTKLINHYEKTLGAYHFKNQRMIIETQASRVLVEKYFKI